MRSPADVQPEDSEGQCCINRALQFLAVHAEHGESRLTPAQQSARVNWPKGFLQINGRAQLRHCQIGKVLPQNAFEQALVGCACGPFERCRPWITLPANVEPGWAGLAHLLDGDSKGFTL